MQTKPCKKVSAGLSGLLVLSVLLIQACEPEPVLQGVLSTRLEGPVFLGCEAVSPTQVDFSFSEPVNLSILRFAPPLEIKSVQEGETLSASVAEPLAEGERISADLIVEDAEGNTLSVIVPFRTRNDRMPKLRITEIRTEYSKPKVEFIEFQALSSGQLGALRLISSDRGFSAPLYEFPRAEVAEGEYIVVHLRTLDPAAVDECGRDRGESAGTEASPSARDFWVPGTEKKIRKTDGIALVDQDGRALDAVLLSESQNGAWIKPEVSKIAQLFFEKDYWKGQEEGSGGLLPSDSVSSAGTTTTRTVCRDETSGDSDTAAEWYISATGGATPGGPNKTGRYVPQGK
jgi:hypothetical protein